MRNSGPCGHRIGLDQPADAISRVVSVAVATMIFHVLNFMLSTLPVSRIDFHVDTDEGKIDRHGHSRKAASHLVQVLVM